jgi:hypothetical protein
MGNKLRRPPCHRFSTVRPSVERRVQRIALPMGAHCSFHSESTGDASSSQDQASAPGAKQVRKLQRCPLLFSKGFNQLNRVVCIGGCDHNTAAAGNEFGSAFSSLFHSQPRSPLTSESAPESQSVFQHFASIVTFPGYTRATLGTRCLRQQATDGMIDGVVDRFAGKLAEVTRISFDSRSSHSMWGTICVPRGRDLTSGIPPSRTRCRECIAGWFHGHKARQKGVRRARIWRWFHAPNRESQDIITDEAAVP